MKRKLAELTPVDISTDYVPDNIQCRYIQEVETQRSKQDRNCNVDRSAILLICLYRFVLELWAKRFPETIQFVAVVTILSMNAAGPLLYILFTLVVYLTELSVA
jgi:hypothetical protein